MEQTIAEIHVAPFEAPDLAFPQSREDHQLLHRADIGPSGRDHLSDLLGGQKAMRFLRCLHSLDLRNIVNVLVSTPNLKIHEIILSSLFIVTGEIPVAILLDL